METAHQRRKRKLIGLIAEHGVRALADKAGLNWQALDQVAKGVKNEPRRDGTATEKNLGNAAARAIEAAFSLGDGWFDADDLAAPAQAGEQLDPFEALLLKTFRKFTSLENKHFALVEMNNLLVKLERKGEASDANPVIDSTRRARGRSIFGDLEETPPPRRREGKS